MSLVESIVEICRVKVQYGEYMKKSSIYTRSGDKGQTSLVDGSRVSKSEFRIDVYGDIDEFNSVLGQVLSLLNNFSSSHEETKSFVRKQGDLILHCQSRLFDLGGMIACPADQRKAFKLFGVQDKDVQEIEINIDELDQKLEPLKNFILPGGNLLAATIHVARTQCRRVERKLCHLDHSLHDEIPSACLEFVNRLSDYLFVLARSIIRLDHGEEVKWIQSKD